MTWQVACGALDVRGRRCRLAAGHAGGHEASQKTSGARIIVTPLILLVAAVLVGSATGQTMIALLVAVLISVIYILVASNRK
jgi:hypothetical protein